MSSKTASSVLKGLASARGLAVGPVFVSRENGEISIPEYRVKPGDEADELLRFRRATFEAKRDLEEMIRVLRERTGRSDVKVFECHMMLVEDVVLADETEKYILENRVNAETAVHRTAEHAREIFGQMNDPYFRERVRDLDDVERRLLSKLTGVASNSYAELCSPSIIVADDLTPSEMVQLPREFVLGFATNGGSATSHVALLARSMGLPAVTGLGNLTSLVHPGETIVLDGSEGQIILSPSEEMIRSLTDRIERQRESLKSSLPNMPAGMLRDGGEVRLLANLHPGAPRDGVIEFGARGVGLYRSEYLWLNSEREPSENEQFVAYREIAEWTKSMGIEAVATIRVLDIGGDKIVRGLSMTRDMSVHEPNPFLGNRSIRYLLSNPDVFKTQLRAIVRASAFGPVAILYPMISCVEELRAAKALLAEVKESLSKEGVSFAPEIPEGVMIETPAAAINAEAFAPEVDFFSIGTNDLVQYTLAADRGNEAVAHLYQPTHPSILRLMQHVFSVAKRAQIEVSVCGESAADPVLGILWVAMGADALSMSPMCIPVLAKLLMRFSRQELDAYAQEVESFGFVRTGREIYEDCRAYLRARIPDWDGVVL